MDDHSMTAIALILLGCAAAGGLVMLYQVFIARRDRPWSWLAMLHGFLAAAGLTLLIYASLMAGVAGMINAGLVVLALAALGGGYLALKYHVRQLPLSRPVVLGHAALAVVGFLLVLVGSGVIG